MLLPSSFGMIRCWRRSDAAALVKYANNRKIWLNMRDAFPHPYTEDDASAFLDLADGQDPVTFFAIATESEAVSKFSEYALDRYDLKRIYAEPYASNAASCRVLEEAGYAKEGRLRSSVIKDGRILDQFLYARIR